ncbi:glycosyltransferase [Neobacillus jeddahensis]|uniref:glycosyltransferase n=1 Tax=Neobacillus jeddahensis TaxID=1461580 RepID=UPI00059163DC|nr:glycosyltransferase [Neobacillus jeddahensis]
MKINKSILVVAYACESDKGSEPAVGWNWTIMLSKIFKKVYLLTRSNNIKSVKEGLYKESINNVEIIGYDLPRWALKIKKKLKITRLYYLLWQYGGIRKVRKENFTFEVIQHVTFVNDYLPSLFYKLRHEKFIWGPIGSNEPIPKLFIKDGKHKILDYLKHKFKDIQRFLNPDFKQCVKKADHIIGTNYGVMKNLKIDKGKFSIIPAIGIDVIEQSNKIHANPKKVILFVGNLVSIKNPCIALEAFIDFNNKNRDSEFWVIGDGPERAKMEKIVDLNNKDSSVKFFGRLTRDEVICKIAAGDVVIFPTLETAGFVTLEAISLATPVISLNIGGPSYYLPKELQVDISNSENTNDVSKGISQKLFDVFDNYDYFSKICGEMANEYTWNEKVKLLKLVYAQLLKEN